jgi:hypothetical protein
MPPLIKVVGGVARPVVSIPSRALRRWIIRQMFRIGVGVAGRRRDIVDHNPHMQSKFLTSHTELIFQSMSSGCEGLFTIRFSVVKLDSIGIDVSAGTEGKTWEFLKRFSEEFSKKGSVKEKIDLVQKLSNSLVESGCIKGGGQSLAKFQQVLAEELLHQEMLRGTSLSGLVDAISWEERILLMYILELAHRALGRLFPRSPERDDKWKSGLNSNEIEKVLGEARNRLEKSEDLKMKLTNAFNELRARIFFKYGFYPLTILPFVEAPTWAILKKLGLMSEKDVDSRIQEYFYNIGFKQEGVDKLMLRRAEIAEEVYKIAESRGVEDIIPIVRKSLNPPIDDVKKCLEVGGVEGIRKLQEEIFNRFTNVAKNRDVSVYGGGGGAGWLKLLRVFRVSDIADVFSDMLSEEPGVVNCIISLLDRFGVLEEPAVVLMFRDSAIIYDPLTMVKGPKICGGVIVKRTGRELGTLEDLVGSAPLVLRGYLLLRHYMHYRDEDSIDFLNLAKAHVGVDEATWNEYINYIGKLKYVDFREKIDYVDPSYAIDSILGVIYSFAKLGEKATRLGGLHGIYKI